MTRPGSESEACAGSRAAGGPGFTLATSPYSQRDLCYYFLRLSALGSGGPVALIGDMQRDLVEPRHWISRVPQPLVILGAGVIWFIIYSYHA